MIAYSRQSYYFNNTESFSKKKKCRLAESLIPNLLGSLQDRLKSWAHLSQQILKGFIVPIRLYISKKSPKLYFKKSQNCKIIIIFLKKKMQLDFAFFPPSYKALKIFSKQKFNSIETIKFKLFHQKKIINECYRIVVYKVFLTICEKKYVNIIIIQKFNQQLLH